VAVGLSDTIRAGWDLALLPALVLAPLLVLEQPASVAAAAAAVSVAAAIFAEVSFAEVGRENLMRTGRTPSLEGLCRLARRESTWL
jgi:hypothetical protein